jgi:hypothetical protein
VQDRPDHGKRDHRDTGQPGGAERKNGERDYGRAGDGRQHVERGRDNPVNPDGEADRRPDDGADHGGRHER